MVRKLAQHHFTGEKVLKQAGTPSLATLVTRITLCFFRACGEMLHSSLPCFRILSGEVGPSMRLVLDDLVRMRNTVVAETG